MKNDSLGDIVYSTDSNQCPDAPITYSKKCFAPECGSVFSAKVCKVDGKSDYLIDRIQNYTGYIKKNFEKPDLEVSQGKFYRFKVIGGPFTKNYHNFFYVVPVRGLGEKENRNLNLINPQTSLLLTRLGEFMLGLKFDKRSKKLRRLKKSQRNWGWFLDNFDVGI